MTVTESEDYKYEMRSISLPFNTIFRDPVYGTITVTSKRIVSFIDTYEVQRLRRIQQLGNTSYVYQSGTHTRFEHSIGVMHLSGEFFDKLINLSNDKWKKYQHYKELVMLAGLLHDVGHGPKSHLFEEAMKLRNPPIKFSHEDYSAYIIKKINDEKLKCPTERKYALSNVELQLVLSMIKGDIMDIYPNFLFSIVANKKSGFDTDKLDYLKRDSHHLGLPTIDINDIMSSMCIIDGNITFKRSVWNDIAKVYNTRKEMFTKVYYHETVKKIDKIYICALKDMPFDTTNPDWVLELDDYWMENKLRKMNHPVAECINMRKVDHECINCAVRIEKVATLCREAFNPMECILFIE